ncbi:MMPL family transporter [Endozoicomonas atrinae]|uniref:MMPL family transporter n=1 Tax=Endozoicomonas atrinae TaxID=1333660 RepID=UPI00082629F0|nr:hypothetical protein [Endozoicomonas atrinae]
MLISLLNGYGRLSTDLMALLPATEQDPASAAASQRFMENFSQRVTLVISSPSRDKVRKATQDLEGRLQESGIFQQLVARLKPELWENIGHYYYPYRYQLAGSDDRTLPSDILGERLINNSLNTLASPMGMVGSDQLLNDPLFLMSNWFRSLQGSAGQLKPDEGFLTVEQSGKYHIMITGLLKGEVLTLSRQASVVTAINDAVQAVEGNFSYAEGASDRVEITASGMIFHAKAGADSAQSEVSTIGVGSLLGVVFLILMVFRTVWPLLFCLISIATGVLAGYLATAFVFGNVHVMTLVFGASLIGISIDYSFHYLVEWWRQGKAWSPVAGLRHILPGIALGLLTSLLGYLPMLATPFPGLQQIAVFSCSGLMMAWLTVVFAYPWWLRNACAHSGKESSCRWLSIWVDWFLTRWQTTMTGRRKIWVTLVLLPILIGLSELVINDDIRQLQKRSSSLEAADEFVQSIIGDVGDSRFFLVYGSTEQSLLELDETLGKSLRTLIDQGQLTGFQSISRLMPSVKSQADSYQKLTSVYQHQLPDFWQQLGVTEAGQQVAMDAFIQASDRQIQPEQWLASDAASLYGYLWLGNVGERYYSAVLIQGANPDWQPEQVAALHEGVLFVDKTGETSYLFGRYRALMGWLLVTAYGLITVLLSVRFGVKGALSVVMPPLLSVILTLSVLGFAGQSINLFHILALLMILGIGVDYTLFFREAGSNPRYTLMAITLSAITTVLSFGLLALSETAAIRGFGLTVLLGISFCYLLSPLAIRKASL